jgi:hypothetical protein
MVITIAIVASMSLSPIIKTDDIGFMQVRKDYRKQAYYYTVVTASKVKKRWSEKTEYRYVPDFGKTSWSDHPVWAYRKKVES